MTSCRTPAPEAAPAPPATNQADTTTTQGPRANLRRWWVVFSVIVVLAAAATHPALSNKVYATWHPGPAYDVLPQLRSASPTPSSATPPAYLSPDGALVVPTVQVVRLGWWGWLWATVTQDPYLSSSPADAEPAVPVDTVSVKRDAALAAVAVTGVEPSTLFATQVVVTAAPQTSALRKDDVVTAVNGTPVTSLASLASLASLTSLAATTAASDTVVVERDGAPVTVPMSASWAEQVTFTEAALGPPTVDVDLGVVQGASSGLMLALAYVDLLLPGALIGNQAVAGSGAVDSSGRVTDVQGLPLKARSAATASASLLFVPTGQTSEITDTPMPVVEVASVAEAVRYLCALGATDAVCARLG